MHVSEPQYNARPVPQKPDEFTGPVRTEKPKKKGLSLKWLKGKSSKKTATEKPQNAQTHSIQQPQTRVQVPTGYYSNGVPIGSVSASTGRMPIVHQPNGTHQFVAPQHHQNFASGPQMAQTVQVGRYHQPVSVQHDPELEYVLKQSKIDYETHVRELEKKSREESASLEKYGPGNDSVLAKALAESKADEIARQSKFEERERAAVEATLSKLGPPTSSVKTTAGTEASQAQAAALRDKEEREFKRVMEESRLEYEQEQKAALEKLSRAHSQKPEIFEDGALIPIPSQTMKPTVLNNNPYTNGTYFRNPAPTDLLD